MFGDFRWVILKGAGWALIILAFLFWNVLVLIPGILALCIGSALHELAAAKHTNRKGR